MNREDFYDELGKIDPEYIEEADMTQSGRKPVFSGRKWIAVAAACVIMIGAAGRSDAVQAAIKKIFTFIPGVGIEESEEGRVVSSDTLFSMDGDPVTKSNGKVTVTLINAYINRDSVDVEYKITFDFLEKYGEIKGPDEYRRILTENGIGFKDIEGTISSIEIPSALTIDGEVYNDLRYSGGGGTRERRNVVRADGLSEKINELGENLPVRLSVAGLDFDIKFKPIENYDTIDDIGPSMEINGISVTAVPRWDGDTLYVDLYDLNYSEFSQVFGYIEYSGTEEEQKMPYLIIDGNKINADYDGGDGTEFYFDLSDYGLTDDEKAALELHLPVIVVRNDENVVIPFTVNDDGSVEYPHKVSLSCCDIYITDMRPSDMEGWENGMEMDFTAMTKRDDMKVCSISFGDAKLKEGAKRNIFESGGSSWSQSENGFWETGFVNDRALDVRDYESITISSAEYIIEDEYVLPLGQESADGDMVK